MSSKYLGQPFDIHGGGQDLIFPHHENETAQSEAANKKPFVNYWLHNGFVQVNKEKMSKSLGNFFTLREMCEKYNPIAFRYLVISTHYRVPIEFSNDSLEQAKNSLERIKEFMENSKISKKNLDKKLIDSTRENFIKAMDDDFDTPRALAVIFDFIREANKQGNGKNAYILLKEFDKVLGILKEEKITIPKEIIELAKQRETARKNKDFKKADQIREQLKQKGFLIEDSDEEYKIKKENKKRKSLFKQIRLFLPQLLQQWTLRFR